jgi:tetratricopeptide (TPR) repeat protein
LNSFLSFNLRQTPGDNKRSDDTVFLSAGQPMRVRLVWLSCCFCLGCQTINPMEPRPKDALWEKGQEAMRAGKPDDAVACYEALAHKKPGQVHLSLAAAYMAKGDEVAASLALGRFVEENPDHRNARFYYAELLRRLGQNQEAFAQFERAVATLQEDAKSDYPQLIRCHGRLMELAEAQQDDYQAHLHRGVGLYWLAQGSRTLGAENAELSPEGLLCKAAGELSLAHALRPHEARPSWYRYSVWRSLAQTHLAERCLKEAREAAPFTFLTPAEARSLQLAGTVLK